MNLSEFHTNRQIQMDYGSIPNLGFYDLITGRCIQRRRDFHKSHQAAVALGNPTLGSVWVALAVPFVL